MHLRVLDDSTVEAKRKTEVRVVGIAEVEVSGSRFIICNTHFTWTPDGKTDQYQLEDLPKLLSILEHVGEFVLCGDFNAPRGKEIFDELARRYTDNVPPRFTSSIDGTRHKHGALHIVVDGIFSTSPYVIRDFSMVHGVSDHCALTATVTRK